MIRKHLILPLAAILLLGVATARANIPDGDYAYIKAIEQVDPQMAARMERDMRAIGARDLSEQARDDALLDLIKREKANVDRQIQESDNLGEFADQQVRERLRQTRSRLLDYEDEIYGDEDGPPPGYLGTRIRYRIPELVDEPLPKDRFVGFSCPTQFSWEPINVGPNSEVGSAAATREKVKDTLGGALGGGGGRSLGGGGSFGLGGSRGGGSSLPRAGSPGSGQDPRLGEDIVPDGVKTTVRDPASGGSISIGGLYRDNALHVSSTIMDAPYDADGTFQTIFLETPYGTRAAPIRYTLIVLYQDWKLTVSWTYDRWVNGEHVEHREGGWSESGRNILGTWTIPSEGEGLWSDLGFGTAQKGAKGLLVEFPIGLSYLQKYPVKITTHVTTPNMDPVMTVPFETYLQADTEGNVHTLDRGQAVSSYLLNDHGWSVGLNYKYNDWGANWDTGYDTAPSSGGYRTGDFGVDIGSLLMPNYGVDYNQGTIPDSVKANDPIFNRPFDEDGKIRYLSPTIAGFTLGATWDDEPKAEDDDPITEPSGFAPDLGIRWDIGYKGLKYGATDEIDLDAPGTQTRLNDFLGSIQMGALSWQRPDYSFDPGIEDKAWDLDGNGDFDVGFKADYGLRAGGLYTSPDYLGDYYEPTLSEKFGKVTYKIGRNYFLYDDANAPNGTIADPDAYDAPFTFVKGVCLNF